VKPVAIGLVLLGLVARVHAWFAPTPAPRYHVPQRIVPRYVAEMGECATCGRPRARATERCTGERWAAGRVQTSQCAVLFKHRRAVVESALFIPGCEICDAGGDHGDHAA